MKNIVVAVTALTIILVLTGWTFSVQSTPPQQVPLSTTKISPPRLVTQTYRLNHPPITTTPSLTIPIPKLITQLNTGVPIGNSKSPTLIAVDGRHQRAYSLNQTLDDERYTILVIDTQTDELITFIDLPATTTTLPWAWELQVDPYRSRLYVVWGDLTVIDTETLTVTRTIRNVGTLAPGPEHLYLANECHLWMADPISMTRVINRPMPPPSTAETGPLLLNAKANRLYLGHKEPSRVEIFAADTLTPVNTSPLENTFAGAVVDETNNQLWVMNGYDRLDRLDADGQWLYSYMFPGDSYERVFMAINQHKLDVVRATETKVDYLNSFDLNNLNRIEFSILSIVPKGLAMNRVTGEAYMPHTSKDDIHFILKFDPTIRRGKQIHTNLSVVDVVSDPTTGQVYVIDQQGTLRILALSDFHEITRLDTHIRDSSYGTRFNQLLLDSEQHHLYVGEWPMLAINTQALTIAVLNSQRQREIKSHQLQTKKGITTTDVYGLYRPILYDSQRELFYAKNGIFDKNLTLLGVHEIPGEFLALDSESQLIFSADKHGNLFIAATPSGQLHTPPTPTLANEPEPRLKRVTAGGTRFELYKHGLRRSDDEGQHWEWLGAGLPNGKIQTIAISPNFDQDQLLFLIKASSRNRVGGLYRSTDGGRHWYPSHQGLPTINVTSVHFFPTFEQDNSILVGAKLEGESGTSLFRSTDGGQHWQNLGHSFLAYANVSVSSVFSPNFAEDRILFLRATVMDEIYRSIDDGLSWEKTGARGGRLIFSPNFTDDGLIITDRLWRSTDRGQTWQLTTSLPASVNYVTEQFFTPGYGVENETIYVAVRTSPLGEATLKRSTDAGLSWQTLPIEAIPHRFRYSYIEFLPPSRLHLTTLYEEQLTLDLEELRWK